MISGEKWMLMCRSGPGSSVLTGLVSRLVKVVVVAVGRLRPPYADDVQHYQRLLARHARLEIIEVREDQQVVRRIPERAFVSALDADGETMDSVGFSRFLEERRMEGRDLCFVIGGAFSDRRRAANPHHHPPRRPRGAPRPPTTTGRSARGRCPTSWRASSCSSSCSAPTRSWPVSPTTTDTARRVRSLVLVIAGLLVFGSIGFSLTEHEGVWDGFVRTLDPVATTGSIPGAHDTGGEVLKGVLTLL